MAAALKAERNERQAADTRLTNQLKKAVAEGLPLARVGAIFFLIGITAGTASPEIASIFGGSPCQTAEATRVRNLNQREDPGTSSRDTNLSRH
jgi:hypothetical protein